MAQLKFRKLGSDSRTVTALGLGCMSIGSSDTYTSSAFSRDSAVALVQHALNLGITLLDTADIYGDSELLVGEAIKGRRDEIVLATKFGFVRGAAR